MSADDAKKVLGFAILSDSDRAPSADERAGMEWWNGIHPIARAYWLRGYSTPAAAWEAYKNAADVEALKPASAKCPISLVHGHPTSPKPPERVIYHAV